MQFPKLNPEKMKAWTCTRYGSAEVLRLVELPMPIPGNNEILVKIRATTVSAGDVRIRSFNLPRGFGLIGRLVLGMRGPRQPILGSDFAGTIAAVGKNVTAFHIGDEVMGFAGAALRCHAEYRTLATTKPIALKPDNLSFAEAASLPFGAMTAWHYLGKAQIKAGEKILVIGASGAVGSAFVQLANYLGATVTAVTSGGNVRLVQSLGAHSAIDYTQEDFTTGSQRYDVIADTVGASSFAKSSGVLNPHGRYISVAGTLADVVARGRGTLKSIGGPASERAQDFQELVQLAKQGALRPLIDRTFKFELMREAHAYVETGRKKGSVVIEMP
jgi:NADPH:quinone reductase-like Zn-dependent oxidoreductase